MEIRLERRKPVESQQRQEDRALGKRVGHSVRPAASAVIDVQVIGYPNGRRMRRVHPVALPRPLLAAWDETLPCMCPFPRLRVLADRHLGVHHIRHAVHPFQGPKVAPGVREYHHPVELHIGGILHVRLEHQLGLAPVHQILALRSVDRAHAILLRGFDMPAKRDELAVHPLAHSRRAVPESNQQRRIFEEFPPKAVVGAGRKQPPSLLASRHIRAAIEDHLQRERRVFVILYQVHAVDTVRQGQTDIVVL
ncbi:MAG: hypothetical protein AMJ46_14230 [Latescibacteria bacterium DG_63]|nr:MAG: hypothetical protein AMJ46_14230 [Latescibacteria bacterium DG_63]